MSQPFLGQLMTVGFNFAPRHWSMCAGQIMSIQQNTALFSLLGTTYGGNGQQTFGLPDLRGRTAIGTGQGPGLSDYVIGEMAGSETTTLTSANMPAHVHPLLPNTVTVNAVNVKGSEQVPEAGAFLGRPVDSAPTGTSVPEIYVPAPAGSGQPLVPLGGVNVAGSTGISGSNVPINNLQPFLAITQIIALQGIFPSRN